MGLGFDADTFQKHWKGAVSTWQGNTVYDPMTRTYIPVPQSAVPANPPTGGPDTTESRLTHIEALQSAGRITAQEAATARAEILRGGV
jgi:hypothetical protein